MMRNREHNYIDQNYTMLKTNGGLNELWDR